MNNKDFITELAERTGYSAEDTQRMADIVIESMADYFLEGETVLIPTFGTFEVKKKTAYACPPKTGA